MEKFLKRLTCLLVGVVFTPLLTQADVRVLGTRFIFPDAEREIFVRLANSGSQPALVQTWLDSGDPEGKPGAENLPFIILPPLSRVEAGKELSLRIARISGVSPQDRESVYWLNVLEVPHKAKNTQDRNVMQLAIRTRLKIFYRPNGLLGTSTDALDKLSWSLVPGNRGDILRVYNDSAYHTSFTYVGMKIGNTQYDFNHSDTVAPHATHDFPLDSQLGSTGAAQVKIRWIDDLGVSHDRNYTLKPYANRPLTEFSAVTEKAART